MKSHKADAKPHFRELLGNARALRHKLAAFDIKAGLTVIGGGEGPKAVACVFDFSGVSQSAGAQKMIKLLEQQGCGCASTGEDDVCCYCND